MTGSCPAGTPCPPGWQADKALVGRLVKDLAPAVARDTGGALYLPRFGGCGTEGCVVFARHPVLGPVVLKVGDQPARARGKQRSDYEAAALLVGQELPGVAKVFGAWQSPRTGAYGVLRERVRTDWRQFMRESRIRDRTLYTGLGALTRFGESLTGGCAAGYVARPSKKDARAIRRSNLQAVAQGLVAMGRFGVCAGNDVTPANIGWRRPSRCPAPGRLLPGQRKPRFARACRPEPVLLDIGFAAEAGGVPWTTRPALAAWRMGSRSP